MATAVATFENLFLPIVSAPSFPRCPHSVYLAGESEKAPYCSVCTPGGPKFKTKKVVLPRSSSDPMAAHELRANVKPDYACPDCLSTIYIDLENGTRECADCSKVYPAPRRRAA